MQSTTSVDRGTRGIVGRRATRRAERRECRGRRVRAVHPRRWRVARQERIRTRRPRSACFSRRAGSSRPTRAFRRSRTKAPRGSGNTRSADVRRPRDVQHCRSAWAARRISSCSARVRAASASTATATSRSARTLVFASCSTTTSRCASTDSLEYVENPDGRDVRLSAGGRREHARLRARRTSRFAPG